MIHSKTTLFAVAIMALAAAGASAATIYFQESGGQVVMEAENFQNSTTSATDEWQVLNTGFTNFRGAGFIQATPDTGNNNSSAPNDPTVEYIVDISTTGTYELFARTGAGNQPGSGTGFSNSFWAEIVGSGHVQVAVDGNQDFDSNPWNSAGSWTIGTPGFYTVRISMREDGAAIDTLILQLDSVADPAGDGPAESTLVPEPASIVLLGLGGLMLVGRKRS